MNRMIVIQTFQALRDIFKIKLDNTQSGMNPGGNKTELKVSFFTQNVHNNEKIFVFLA